MHEAAAVSSKWPWNTSCSRPAVPEPTGVGGGKAAPLGAASGRPSLWSSAWVGVVVGCWGTRTRTGHSAWSQPAVGSDPPLSPLHADPEACVYQPTMYRSCEPNRAAGPFGESSTSLTWSSGTLGLGA